MALRYYLIFFQLLQQFFSQTYKYVFKYFKSIKGYDKIPRDVW